MSVILSYVYQGEMPVPLQRLRCPCISRSTRANECFMFWIWMDSGTCKRKLC